MCLHYSPTETKQLRNKLTISKRRVRFYKLYAKSSYLIPSSHGYLFSPYRNGDYPVNISPKGEVVSNRVDKVLTTWEEQDREVYKGIHVFRSLTAVRNYVGVSIKRLKNPGCSYVLLEVLGDKEDLIGANKGQAVFTKIQIASKCLNLKRVKKCIAYNGNLFKGVK